MKIEIDARYVAKGNASRASKTATTKSAAIKPTGTQVPSDPKGRVPRTLAKALASQAVSNEMLLVYLAVHVLDDGDGCDATKAQIAEAARVPLQRIGSALKDLAGVQMLRREPLGAGRYRYVPLLGPARQVRSRSAPPR